MQDLADREAQQLVDALKALEFDGVSVRGRAYLPLDRAAYRGSSWARHWRLMLTVRWQGQELTVEHLADAPLYAVHMARSVAQVFRGVYADERFRCDRLRDLVPEPPPKLTLDSLI